MDKTVAIKRDIYNFIVNTFGQYEFDRMQNIGGQLEGSKIMVNLNDINAEWLIC